MTAVVGLELGKAVSDAGAVLYHRSQGGEVGEACVFGVENARPAVTAEDDGALG
ncbi:hypothetical protein [Phytoactinopolyspora endophytica]|uniref:hypothetical protein n=1 Tax=Phytoactinopolyspora endophytica TaxID=1642495 RepID=UPI003B831879